MAETITEQLLQKHLESAWQAIQQGATATAMESAKQASLIAPEEPEILHVLGLLASRDGRADLALPLLQKALNAGVTEKRLRSMAESLLMANQPQVALQVMHDCLAQFGDSAEAYGLLSAVQVALEDFEAASQSAKRAIALKPHLMAWESTLGYCELMHANIFDGLKTMTGRVQNLEIGSRAPAFHFSKPCDIWIKSELIPGDSLFNLRYAPLLTKLGYKLHIQTDKKTKVILRETGYFDSVKEKLNYPADGFWLQMGDVPLAAIQAAKLNESTCIVAPLALKADEDRVEKLRQKLKAIGPAPYIAATWRAGPKGKKQRNGLRMFTKQVDAEALGKVLSGTQATIISLQRLPEAEENAAFQAGLGRAFVDLSMLNDNLQDMLALLTLVDAYVTVPNTNVHLREGLGLPSKILLNRPFQDWRWLAAGDKSPWYPNATIYRQPKGGDWQPIFTQLAQELKQAFSKDHATTQTALNSHAAEGFIAEIADQRKSEKALNQQLQRGWEAISDGNIADAMRVAQEVMQINPEFAPALHLLGWTAFRDLKVDLAIALLQKAASLAPSNGGILGDLVRVMVVNGETIPALELSTQGLADAHMERKAPLHYARAAVYVQLNRLPEAIADYEECMRLAPQHLDAMSMAGMSRLKIGDVRLGFRLYSARTEARMESRRDGHVSPWLRGDLKGLKLLVRRDMGLGDELTYLRYLPWLIQAGVEVTYWAGKKLVPLLQRMGYASHILSDQSPLPDKENYDLGIWVEELPAAVEALDAPAIPPALPLKPRADLVEKWRAWLASCGTGPYIGINWRAGVAASSTATAFSKLAKAVDKDTFAQSLAEVNATFVCLQRNVMQEEITAFQAVLGAPLHDVGAITDDLEDLLALMSLLDENIGVSNTNMHLRASVGKGSRVLVQTPGGDWRWGYEGNQSLWFTESKVYRQSLNGSWADALENLRTDLLSQYGQKKATVAIEPSSNPAKQAKTRAASKRIIWVTAGKISNSPQGKTSDLASARYRVLQPAKALAESGWQSEFVNEGLSEVMGGWGSSVPTLGDTVIISKVFTTHAVHLAQDAQSRGAQVIVDFCDNFLEHPKRGPLQLALLKMADKVVASTIFMAEALKAHGYRADAVISDPVEFTQGDIQFNPGETLKLLWFGHAVNLDTLAQFLPTLTEYSQRQKLSLNVVTTLANGAADLSKITPAGLEVHYTPWSVEATQQAISDCDIVIIPTISSDTKKAKSPNRLLEPLWAGRMVVAGELPAYLPFADSAWVGKNLTEGVAWAIENPAEVRQRIAQGQKDIAQHFCSTAISQQWMQVFQIDSSIRAEAHKQTTKLHLGCGDKILEGYVNVDVVASRAGKAPDVMCDLHKLEPFLDNSFDEILSVHVVEHFWRWEVLDILKEWVRVLKPGGKMILECPNLKSACEEFLKNPDAAAFGGPEGQRSMWVFYGDPRWQDPYMVHRWGYTPESLAKLMHEAGLVDARQEPAQYKLREPRDMRIVAFKPHSS